MPGLVLSDVLTICDSLAQQGVTIKTSGFDAVAAGHVNNRATILAASSSSDFKAVTDLSAAFQNNVVVTVGALYAGRFAALNGTTGGLSAFLATNDARVDAALRDILGWALTPVSIFPPIYSGANKLGSYLLSGAGAGTYTDNIPVDTTKYGKAWLTLKTVGQTASANIVVTVVGKKLDGTTQTKTATINSGTTVNTLTNVGTLGTSADHFVDVTSVTVTGGGASDAFEIQTRLERAIAL